jgi:hypothetical protein
MKAVKKLINTINKATNKNNNKNKATKTTRKNINNKINRINKRITNISKRNNFRNRNKMPAANIKNLNRDFRILYQDGNTVRVTGRDLVYKIPSDVTSQYNSDIITVIPANPCYWIGTRIAALAQGYQNYRPLNIKFNYIPQCAVTQQGNVIAGTLWNQAPSNVNLQQSLRTSNGGQLSQCYKPFTSVVRMKTNLQYNLYKTAGQFDQESNPFIYIAMAVGCLNEQKQNIIPGYFYVTWSFVLKNPIGNTNIFYNSGLTLYQDTGFDYDNSTAVFLNANENELPRGAILQLEKDEQGEQVATYNGSYYDLNGDDLIWQFSNSTIQNNSDINQKYDFYYDSIETGGSSQTYQYQFALLENNELYPDQYMMVLYDRPDARRIPKDTKYYLLSTLDMLEEGVGTFVGFIHEFDPTDHVFVALAPKNLVNLVSLQDNKILKSRKRDAKNINNNSQTLKQYVLSNNKPIKQQKIKQSKSDKYYTNIAPIFETS